MEIRGDGRFETGSIVPTILAGEGIPARDPAEQAHGVVRTLSRADFGPSGVRISPAGVIAKPPATERAASSAR